MTGLRLKDGVNLDFIALNYPELYHHFKDESIRQIALGNLIEKNGILSLTKQGKFISDAIAADFFEV
jgi:coproporphyrinogen III oxidase-like Fe-S oxidoreductase